MIPAREMQPLVGRILKRLFADAGLRRELTVSVPVAHTLKEAATAAPDPPELPPGVRVESYGLMICPPTLFVSLLHIESELAIEPSEDTDRPSKAISCIFAFPRIIAPALRRTATTGASTVGCESANATFPPVVAMSAVS